MNQHLNKYYIIFFCNTNNRRTAPALRMLGNGCRLGLRFSIHYMVSEGDKKWRLTCRTSILWMYLQSFCLDEIDRGLSVTNTESL